MASGSARFSSTHTAAHIRVAAMIFIRSGSMCLKPRCPKRFFSASSSITMPLAPAMEVASARPFAPRKIRRIRFSVMFSPTTTQETQKGVVVSWMAWNTRFKKSLSPKAGTPTT